MHVQLSFMCRVIPVIPSRRVLRISAFAAMIAGLLWPGIATAQGAKGRKGTEPDKIAGTVTEVERKGKTATLKIEKEDGGKLEVLVTPRMKFTVTGRGDSSLLQPKTIVSSERVVKSNDELFGHEFIVHIGAAPQFSLQRDADGGDWFHVCGQVLAADPKSMTLSFGPENGTQRIAFEEGMPIAITVNSNDTELVTEGSKVELEGATRGAKFLPSRVMVTLEKPLTADDLQALTHDKKSAKKGATAAKGAKKTGKTKTDDSDASPTDSTSDPFGVLGKKDGGAKSGDKPAPEKKGNDKGTDQ